MIVRTPKIFLAVAVAMILFVSGANASAESTTISAEASTTVKVTVKKSVEDYASAAKGNYTGLIVDCRGLGLKTAMSPVIKNINGSKIYGHKNLDIDKIIAIGVADYVNNHGNLSRAGSNPLVVKAIRVDDFNSNPVVSLVDSNRILIENHASKFLHDLKVIFLYD